MKDKISEKAQNHILVFFFSSFYIQCAVTGTYKDVHKSELYVSLYRVSRWSYQRQPLCLFHKILDKWILLRFLRIVANCDIYEMKNMMNYENNYFTLIYKYLIFHNIT